MSVCFVFIFLLQEITLYTFLLENEVCLLASQTYLPGLLFPEEVFSGLCLRLMDSGTLFPECWYPVTASTLKESSFFPSSVFFSWFAIVELTIMCQS